MYKSCSFEIKSIPSSCDLLETSAVPLSNLIQGFSDKEWLSYIEQYQSWVVKEQPIHHVFIKLTLPKNWLF